MNTELKEKIHEWAEIYSKEASQLQSQQISDYYNVILDAEFMYSKLAPLVKWVA